MPTDADDFPGLVEELRAKARAVEGISEPQRRALVSGLDYAEHVFEVFKKGGTREDDEGNWEPPLSRDECADLVAFVLAFAQRGDSRAPVEVELSPGTRRHAFAFHAVLRLFVSAGEPIAYIAPDGEAKDAARSYWDGCLGLRMAQNRCRFLTWEEAASAPPTGMASVADADLSVVSDPSARQAARSAMERLRAIGGLDLFVLSRKTDGS